MTNQTDKQPKPSLAQAMYPSLDPKVKAQNEEAQRKRQRTLELLREARIKITGGR